MSTAVIENTPDAMDSATISRAEQGLNAGQRGGNTRAKPATLDHRIGKYLTFLLGREEFAIQVLKVREIMGILDITAVPQTPPYVKGVIDLRGKVIPVVDLRLKFSLPELEYTQRTCIIVVQVQAAGMALHTGIIVDEVSEVLNIAANDIEDTPDFGDGNASAAMYLLGMAKVNPYVASPELFGLQGRDQRRAPDLFSAARSGCALPFRCRSGRSSRSCGHTYRDGF